MLKNITILVFLVALSCTILNASTNQFAVELSPMEIERIKGYVQRVQQDMFPTSKEDPTWCDFYLEDTLIKAGSIGYFPDEKHAFIAFRDSYQPLGVDSHLAAASFKTIKGHLYSTYQGLFNQTQQSLVERMQRLRLFDDSNIAFTFCGYGTGGATATAAAAYFCDKELPVLNEDNKNRQVHLVTFSAPVVGDLDFVRNFHSRICIENAINFELSALKRLFSQEESLVGVQVPVLLSEQVKDAGGIRGFFSRALSSKQSPTQIFLPSFNVLKRVVAHYQLGYRALRAGLDHCPKIEDIGQISEFSLSRGFFSGFYKAF